jgi:hypothetical protein
VAEETATRAEVSTGSTGTLTELYMALVFLGTSVWTTHATINNSVDSLPSVLADAAAALPGLVAATILTGAGLGGAGASRFRSVGGRLLAGLGLGLLFGIISAAAIRWAYGSGSTIMALAVTVGIASVVGGLLAVFPERMLGAGLWATGWVFFAGVIFGVLQPQIINALGGGKGASAAAQDTANTRFLLGQAVVTGVLAAYFALQKLRTERPAWIWYTLAGALPGLILLGAEWLTRFGGTSLADLANIYAPDTAALEGPSASNRLQHALIVLVVATVVTSIAGAIAAARRGSEDDD